MQKQHYNYNRCISEFKKWHGFQIFVNNKRPHIAVSKFGKIIEVNTKFWAKLTIAQRVFLLNWARYYYRFQSQTSADQKAFKLITREGYDQTEIMQLFETCTFFSGTQKKIRAYNMVTTSKFEHQINTFISWMKKTIFRKK